MSTLEAQPSASPARPQTVLMETSSSAAAAYAKAMVEARYVMAMHRPRNWDQVRIDILTECRRPDFANNQSTWYAKPVGRGNAVEGLGIRFVEMALRCMTNVYPDQSMIFEDEEKEIHRVMVTDLEANLTYSMDVKVSKTVERSSPASDGSYRSVRKNAQGRNVYTVLATEDALLNKRQALVSKAVRVLGLRLIPGDIQDEAEEIIKSVRMNSAARDPNAARKKMVDAFASIGVKASDLAKYLGHELGSCSPAEIDHLRGLYGAIKDGEVTWVSVMEQLVKDSGKEKENPPKEEQPTPATSVDPDTGEITFFEEEPGSELEIV